MRPVCSVPVDGSSGAVVVSLLDKDAVGEKKIGEVTVRVQDLLDGTVRETAPFSLFGSLRRSRKRHGLIQSDANRSMRSGIKCSLWRCGPPHAPTPPSLTCCANAPPRGHIGDEARGPRQEQLAESPGCQRAQNLQMEPADGEHSANVLSPVSAIPASFWPAQGGAKITGPKTRRRMSISFSPDTSKGLGEIRLSCVYERAGEGSPPGGDKADLHYPQELGILHVNVIEARGLPKMDRFSHTDSFAKVQFKDEVGETFVAMDTEDPGWNQEFRFHVHKRNDLRGVMQCSVWDKDDSLRDQSDDVIGQCELELHEELLLGREDDVWMQLKAAPGSPKSVRLREFASTSS